MNSRTGSVIVVTLVIALAACATTPSGTETTATDPVKTTLAASTSTAAVAPTTVPAAPTTVPAAPFPIGPFAGIHEGPVTDELAARLQAALEDSASKDAVAEGWGMSVTVMTPAGTWSGVVGKADADRDVRVDDQFAIASITKSVVASQVMSMVEAGELGLDDPVADHLPPDLEFDTKHATIRHLLGQRSGLPDYYDLLNESQETEFQRVWSPTEILELLPTERTTPGSAFQYTETNYLLLGLVIEHLRGRPLAEVLRDGTLAIDGVERLVHQPDERPSGPMAMPGGDSSAVLATLGGYVPSLAAVTAFSGSGAFASDSLSLARWWRAFCAGEIVSQASLTEMSAFSDSILDGGYGLGLYNPGHGYARAVGHTGELYGYMSWAACLPEDEAVVVVLTNRRLDNGQLKYAFSHGMARPLVEALRAG